MKQEKNVKKSSARIYGIIGVSCLVLFGGMIGYFINSESPRAIMHKNMMNENHCKTIADKIVYATDANLIKELNSVYEKNCMNRFIEEPQKQKIDKECEAKEKELTKNLNTEVKTLEELEQAKAIYTMLIEQGCEYNKNHYINTLLQLQQQMYNIERSNLSTCQQIEELLSHQLNNIDSLDSWDHIKNAETYANLSERGCSEHTDKYKELAAKELEIARALTDDDINNEDKATEIVTTYKRLQMQAEAAKMLEKAKKLTDPAIDFILQLEKIIEE